MFCPKCGAENEENREICGHCGYTLKTVKVIPPLSSETAPTEVPPNLQSIIITGCGVAAMIGGALVLIGWFVPWFGTGGLSNLLTRAMGIAGMHGLLSQLGGDLFDGSPETLPVSIGNGVQVTIGAFLVAIQVLGSGTPLSWIGLLILTADVMYIGLPIMGLACVRQAWGLASRYRRGQPVKARVLNEKAKNIIAYVRSVLVILVIFFIIFAAIPLGLSILGRGFYWVLFGALLALFSTLFLENRLEIDNS